MAIFSFIRRLMLVLSGPANDLVFLSYSNGDEGKNFSDHLNSALIRAGLRTFRNADDTRRGENTESETRKAIQESKISVIVFSKDYAFSTRCLDNVVMIMDAREATGHIVLPIFYHSDPSEVRNQEGRYFEAFSAHEKCSQGEMERVEEWRGALRKAADVAGMVLQDRWCLDELAMIMERRRTVGHIVLPVFYDIDPSEVGDQTGRCGEAFAKHEKRFEDQMERVEGWRQALKEAASMERMVLDGSKFNMYEREESANELSG